MIYGEQQYDLNMYYIILRAILEVVFCLLLVNDVPKHEFELLERFAW